VAEKIIKTSTDKQGQAYIDAGIGEALFNLGRYEEAENYLINSLDLSVKRKQYPPALMAAQRISIVRREQKRFAEALQYQDQFIAFKDSVFNQEKDKLSRELKVKYETREKELQIASLQRENRVASQRNWWIGGSLFLFMGIGFYSMRLQAERRMRQSANEKAMSEAKTLLLQEQLEKQRLELVANRTRLDDYAQMLIDRNQQMAELSAQLLTEKPIPNGRQITAEESPDLYRQSILTDADWEKFQQYFSEVFPGVITKLRVKYPSLTPVETRLILLDKMKLSMKETSTILGVSTEAIKKGRYRLRKKYNLNEDDLSLMVPND
jgi:tetratricopeptide (TPR) repeat protein/DNA-binding CsgD family transcriptional regulator